MSERRAADEVISVLSEYFFVHLMLGEGEPPTESTPLIEVGLLSSLRLAAIAGFVESRFGVQLGAELCQEENVATLRALADCIRSRIASQPD